MTVLWCFLAFVFFASLVEILGCQDVYGLFWKMLSCCKGWMFSLVRGVGGLQFFCATFASKSLKDFLRVFDSHSFGIYRFLSKTIFDWLTPVGAMEVMFRIQCILPD